MSTRTYPRNFLSRRIHSLFGLWLVVFLIEHLLTNSQAALWFGQDGAGFIRAVNAIHNLPYLRVIELVLLGVPFVTHGWWGVRYIFTAKFNSTGGDGRKPQVTRNARNHAFTWQRLTAWVLLVGIILHVIQMRFIDYPETVVVGGQERLYITRVGMDKGLYTLAARLDVKLFDKAMVMRLAEQYRDMDEPIELEDGAVDYSPEEAAEADLVQAEVIEGELIQALMGKMPGRGQVAVVTNDFGKSILLTVRNTFKDPWMILLYSIFVLAAVYHGFRGLWSAMIVWGLTLTERSQYLWSKVAVGFMVVFGFLGLSAVWLTYWVNLRS